jgi:hypothetical protein
MSVKLPNGSFERQQLSGYVKPGFAQSMVSVKDKNSSVVLSVGAEMVLNAYSELLAGDESILLQEAYKKGLYHNLALAKEEAEKEEAFNQPFSAFWKIFFKAEYRGKADILSSLVKMPVALVTVPLEFLFKSIGAAFLRPLSFIRENKSPTRWLYPAAALGWVIGQPFFLIGNTFAYARRTVNAICNVVSSATALMGDRLGWVRDKILKRTPKKFDYGKTYPGFASSIGSAVKNGVLLAVNSAVIGASLFTAGILPPIITSVVPTAVLTAISSATSWISTSVAPLAAGLAATTWAALSASVAVASQAITSGFSQAYKKISDGCSRLWAKCFVSKKIDVVLPVPDSVSRSVPACVSHPEPVSVSRSVPASILNPIAVANPASAGTPIPNRALSLLQKKQLRQLKQQEENKQLKEQVRVAQSALTRIDRRGSIKELRDSTAEILNSVQNSHVKPDMKLYKLVIDSFVPYEEKSPQHAELQRIALNELFKIHDKIQSQMKAQLLEEQQKLRKHKVSNEDDLLEEAREVIMGPDNYLYIGLQELKPCQSFIASLSSEEKEAFLAILNDWTINQLPDEQRNPAQLSQLFGVMKFLMKGVGNADTEMKRNTIEYLMENNPVDNILFTVKDDAPVVDGVSSSVTKQGFLAASSYRAPTNDSVVIDFSPSYGN